MTAGYADRLYVSQFGTDTLGILIHKAGVLADADGNDVDVSLINDDTSATVFTRAASHEATGTYAVTFLSADTAAPGNYHLHWTYALDTVGQLEDTYIEVGRASPAYDGLSITMRTVVERVWIRFADLFDSPFGGPYLQHPFQSHFGRNRIAQLLPVAIGRLNTMAQPYQSFMLDGSTFPVEQWAPLLDQALYIETLKHLIRSYTEQPDLQGSTVSRFDRTRYADRWRDVLRDEEADFMRQRDVFKISFMGLGKASVLVSGGAYGNIGPIMAVAPPGTPRFWARFY